MEEESLNKIKKAKLSITLPSFAERNIQTSQMHELAELLFTDIKNNPKQDYDWEFVRGVYLLFQGGLRKENKKKLVKNLNLSLTTEQKMLGLIDRKFEEISDDTFQMGITGSVFRTIPKDAEEYKPKELSFCYNLFSALANQKPDSEIQSILLSNDREVPNRIPVISCILFAYNPKKYYIYADPASKGLKKKFDINLSINDFADYFSNLALFENIKNEFNLEDFGQVDSLITTTAPENKTMWMVRAGEDGKFFTEFKQKSVVTIGWHIGDLSNITGLEQIRDLVKRKYTEKEQMKLESRISSINYFRFKLKIGDNVITYDPDNRSYLLGEITGDYVYSDLDSNHSHIRKVKWLIDIARDNLSETTRASLNAHQTISELNEAAIKEIRRFLNKMPNFVPKQIILYGPPGTGKTFKTKEYSVKFLEGENINDFT